MAGYSLTVGTFILFSGRLGDLFGYKLVFLVGMGWFALWSLVCGLAAYSNHVLFNLARVLQGVGPALCLPNGIAILGASYAPGRRKAVAFALFASMAPTGSILGSLFASLLALAWWPWAFWVFAVVLVLTTVLGCYAIPRLPLHDDVPVAFWDKIGHLDLPGAVSGVAGLVLFNFAWCQAPIVGWETPYVYVMLILAVLFLAGFFVIELHFSAQPLIPFHVFTSDVSFVLATLACGWACFGIWLLYTYLYLGEIRGASPLLSTAYLSPVVVAGFVAAMIGGPLLHKVGPPLVMTGALVAFMVGTILMATSPVDQTYWAQIFVSAVITPFGMDMSFPAGTLILSNAMPRKHQGIAASLVVTVVNYSTALGLGFAGTVEYNVNNGGQTMEDKLRGFRAAWYVGIGLAGLGVGICLLFLINKARENRRSIEEKEGTDGGSV
jgi:MFS family permease